MTSVIVPAYNASRWIAETVESVLSQMDGSVEVIVVDDGSTDETSAIVARTLPHGRLVKQANQGVSAARAHGTALATGKYIKYLDADDLLVEGVIRRQVEIAEASGADVVYGDWQKLATGADGTWTITESVSRRIEDLNEDIELALFGQMWCPTAAYLWRSDVLRSKHPGWSRTLPVIQDARFALDAAICGMSFAYHRGPAAIYRCHATQSVSTRSVVGFTRDLLRNGREVCEVWRQRGALSPERQRVLLDMCETLGLQSYGDDRELAESCFQFARSIDRNWRPSQTRLRRWVSSTCGVETLARMRLWSVILRNLVRRVSPR